MKEPKSANHRRLAKTAGAFNPVDMQGAFDMTGAMAGSTAMTHRDQSDVLKVVTLTINNSCNLRCPHCYLQYDGPSSVLDRRIFDAIIRCKAEHIAIVGKEPLVDSISVRLTTELIESCVAARKSVSLVTNGLGIHRLQSNSLASLNWMDISLDGGPSTYSQYRRGNFERVILNIREARERGARAVNAMHTLSALNLAFIDDMVSVSELVEWDKIIFSPYVEVRNDGTNATTPIDLIQLVNTLSESSAFRNSDRTVLMLGKNAFLQQGKTDEEVTAIVAQAGLDDKIVQIAHDPLRLGYIRVTYDGYVMTPSQSLHPKDYRSYARPSLDNLSIDNEFRELAAA